MSKSQTIYSCSKCDAQSSKWSGRCLECGKWGTLVESAGKTGIPKSKIDTKQIQSFAEEIKPLSEISSKDRSRIQTGIPDFDTVLGGGIVKGSLILLGGEPGIGKSTLSLQILDLIAKQKQQVLYISGEESAHQIKLRADRLAIDAKSINFLSHTNVETIAGTLIKHTPSLVIVDSIQTIYSKEVESEPGSVSQVRACTVKLLEAAKISDTTVILVGHVTKEGSVAGPKTLEHLVDTVLYLEGDRFHTFRILRTVKNRFGATNEVGIFDMTSKGLLAVKNPSELFLSSDEQLPGSVVTCIVEGSRPLLVEVQALVTKTQYATPARKASGYDTNRLQLLLAVLSKRTKHSFNAFDVHINIVGGLKIKDPATDLALCAALISALTDKAYPKDQLFLGEIGLAGEVRQVKQLAERLKEAKKLGFAKALIPDQKSKSLIETITIKKVEEL